MTSEPTLITMLDIPTSCLNIQRRFLIFVGVVTIEGGHVHQTRTASHAGKNMPTMSFPQILQCLVALSSLTNVYVQESLRYIVRQLPIGRFAGRCYAKSPALKSVYISAVLGKPSSETAISEAQLLVHSWLIQHSNRCIGNTSTFLHFTLTHS